jgi:hypothetical protein
LHAPSFPNCTLILLIRQIAPENQFTKVINSGLAKAISVSK